MKNIKKYEDFLNEELKPETYKSAAEKLDKKGHKSRAKSLSDFANRQHNKQLSDVGYVDIELYGEKHRLDDDNIIIHNDGKKGNVELTITFDREMYDLIGNDDYEQIWNSLNKEEREKFVNNFNGEISIEYNDIMEVSYEDIKDEDTLIEFATMEMSPFIFIEFIDHNPEISGLLINDRKVANKILKLLKNFASVKGGEIEKSINTLTVNDLYES